MTQDTRTEARPAVKALKSARERFAQIDCATIGQMHNTTPQALLDWCKEIASHGFDEASKALSALEAAPEPTPVQPVACGSDIVRLVIAAREIAYSDIPRAHHEEEMAELDKALEVFAERVPWENDPSAGPAAPEPQQEADERDRFKRGLEVLATTFYKDNQYQDYAKHVLGGTTRPQPVASPVTEAQIKQAAWEYLSHKGERPGRILRGGMALWETCIPAMRAALNAASLAPAQDQPE